MELLLTRSQRPGFTSVTFVLDVRTRLTDEERVLVTKYKLGKEILYQKESVTDTMAKAGPLKQLFTAFSAKALGLILTANDLVTGRTITCKDILDMIDTEDQIRKAAGIFYDVLMVCQSFDGEEVITFPRPV